MKKLEEYTPKDIGEMKEVEDMKRKGTSLKVTIILTFVLISALVFIYVFDKENFNGSNLMVDILRTSLTIALTHIVECGVNNR